MTNDLNEFIRDFSIVENAIDMRTLQRWNGRDLLHKENLSEHTHLVVAITITLYDKFKCLGVNFERLIRLSMLHDSLELLRGDILSVTKDAIVGLRDKVDYEENLFLINFVPHATQMEKALVNLADKMACYEFIKLEHSRPHNKFTDEAFEHAKLKAEQVYDDFFDTYVRKQNVDNTRRT